MNLTESVQEMPEDVKKQCDEMLSTINQDPILLSLLYDLDLLPEQISTKRDFGKLVSVVQHWKRR